MDIDFLCLYVGNIVGVKVVEGFEESNIPKPIHEQLRNHLGKHVNVWAAGRVLRKSGILLQVGLDYIEIGQVRNEEVVERQYILLNQIFLIEPKK
ncbi:MAG: hypothetical protein JW779_10195 [Candidatus Thorarchaeota archaeon]|nr:hypothetical protein [Candidatus Thorarchaeota archaeon]